MPALVAWLLGGAAWAFTSSVGRFFTSMGLAFVIKEFVVDDWISEVAGYFGSLPSFAVEILAYFGADVAVTVILSAYAVRWAGGQISGLMRKSGAATGAAM